MDITALDRATGRLVLQIRLDEITEALEGVQLDDNGAASYRAVRRTLQNQLSIIYGEGTDGEDAATAEVDLTPRYIEVTEPEPEPEPTTDCCVCGDTKPKKDTMELECSHIYCDDCIVDLFDLAVHKDTSLFPPRCCKTAIPLDTDKPGVKGYRGLLPAQLLTEVDVKKLEQDKAQETQCAGIDCDHAVPKENISGGIATCDLCNTKTCTTCKGEAHKGLCQEDDDTKVLMATAGKVMWQQCSKCKNMVELGTGCFHIICRCDHQFCYMCGAKWKTCTCPQFDEGHLLRPTPTDALDMAPIVCQHVWVQHEGTACARCDRTDLSSVMQCTSCRIEQCTRCINNRD